MLGSAPGPRLRGAEPLAAAGSVCSSDRSEMIFLLFLIHIFGRTLQSVVLIRLLRLKASLGTPLQAKEHRSGGGLWGLGVMLTCL